MSGLIVEDDFIHTPTRDREFEPTRRVRRRLAEQFATLSQSETRVRHRQSIRSNELSLKPLAPIQRHIGNRRLR
jgi:hypothetical protein